MADQTPSFSQKQTQWTHDVPEVVASTSLQLHDKKSVAWRWNDVVTLYKNAFDFRNNVEIYAAWC